MKCEYAVTFEFMTLPPITKRGEIDAISPRTIAARAIDIAIKNNPNLRWTSMSILLDRYNEMKSEIKNE